MNQQNLSSFIWSVADLLRGDYKQSEYGRVILPFTVLRRLDCVLEPTKEAVLAEMEKREAAGLNPEPFLLKKAGLLFYNTSPLDIRKLMGDQDNIAENMFSYIQAFSPAVRDIFECFDFHTQVQRLDKAGLLYLVTEKFANIDLHPEVVSNEQMGHVFEELIRKFAELSNETAGEHFTPREVIRLMVNLLFIEDDDALTKPGIVRSLYDPTAGTGGMLSVAEDHLSGQNPDARLVMYGQELNGESYAICKADMLIKGQDISNIIHGNTLSDDGLPGKQFDYMLSNPPFGVEWKKIQKAIKKEHQQDGFNGRFGPGLPRVSDGSLLFLMHLISKMRPTKDGGSRFGIVLNGSPLFTGNAGSGESEIRRYVLENDLLEAIIGLPTDMFYNTGISTYIWIVTNRKPAHRKGKVQLIDASAMWQKMRKSLGSKRKELSDDHIAEITRLFGEAKEVSIDGVPISRIFKTTDFGYQTITVERPQLDEDGQPVLETRGKRKGQPKPDSKLRDSEEVPLGEDVDEYFQREVVPHVPDLPAATPKKGEFCVYVLECSDGSFYKGQTDNFPRRLKEHEDGKVSHTSKHLPVRPIHWEVVKSRDAAVAREKFLKSGKGREWLKSQYEKKKLKGFERQAGAWIDHDKTKIGYEIPFNRHFYVFQPPRELDEIDTELKGVTDRIVAMIGELSQ
jgi:type I restriction enzyme M protein